MAKEAVKTTTAAPVIAQPVVTTELTLTSEQEKTIRAMTTKAAQMRFLHALGWKNGPIAKYLTKLYGKEVKYQHVRNQLLQPVKGTAAPTVPAPTQS